MILIDKDKTLREMWCHLWKLEDKIEKEHGLDVIERFNIQRGFEEGLHAVVEQPVAYGWIPVSERLPKNEDDVFVLWKSEAVLVPSVAFYEPSTWYEIMTMEILNVVAWMPIPEYGG